MHLSYNSKITQLLRKDIQSKPSNWVAEAAQKFNWSPWSTTRALLQVPFWHSVTITNKEGTRKSSYLILTPKLSFMLSQSSNSPSFYASWDFLCLRCGWLNDDDGHHNESSTTIIYCNGRSVSYVNYFKNIPSNLRFVIFVNVIKGQIFLGSHHVFIHAPVLIMS